MGPVRGYKKKKKKTIDKQIEQNASALEHEDSVDWWDGFKKRINAYVSSSNESDKFKSVFKMSRNTFNYICSLVKEYLMVKTGNFSFTNGKTLSLNDRVAVGLIRLSSGDSLSTIGDALGLHHCTVTQVTWWFVEAMEERGLHHMKWHEIKKNKSKFEKIRGLPNCCGAIDITHIMMQLPSSEPTCDMWLDSHGNHSMLLQAIVDPDMKFLDIVTGWPGKMDESSVLRNSNFFKLCEEGEILNGDKLVISENSKLREYIVGDSGFPLLPWLTTPYKGKDLSESETKFNEQHFETWNVAPRALARLKEMWRIIHGVMWRPDKHRLPRIILVCCLLHNIVIDMEGVEIEDEMHLSSHVHDLEYHQQICDYVDKKGLIQRDKLCRYSSCRLSLSSLF